MKRTLAAAALLIAVTFAAGCEKEQTIGVPSLATSTPVAAVRTAAAVTTTAILRTPAPTAMPSATATPTIAALASTAAAPFRNCTEARAAGAAPVRVGQPGYGTHLDRDRDGIGCE